MNLKSHHLSCNANDVAVAIRFFEWLGFVAKNIDGNYFFEKEGCFIIQISALSPRKKIPINEHIAFMVADPKNSAEEISEWAKQNEINDISFFEVNASRVMVVLPFLCFHIELVPDDSSALVKNPTLPILLGI